MGVLPSATSKALIGKFVETILIAVADAAIMYTLLPTWITGCARTLDCLCCSAPSLLPPVPPRHLHPQWWRAVQSMPGWPHHFEDG